MAKNRMKRLIRKEASAGEAPRSMLVQVLVTIGNSLRDLCTQVGPEIVKAMLEEDRERLCGPEGRHNPKRLASRYGYDQGSLVLGGRKVTVRKPRVRSKEGKEMVLPS